jgi:hypothetical protein
MKKSLLFIAALFVASFASAQEMEDITPSGYIFANQSVGQYKIAATYKGANPPDQNPDIPKLYNNGFFYIAGAAVYQNWENLQAGTSIVDLGGQVGKVLCINGQNSQFNEQNNVSFPQCTDKLNWFNFFFTTDPNNTPVSPDKSVNLRVRIVMNVFSNVFGESNNIFNTIYCQNNDGSINPNDDNTAERAAVTTGEFIAYDEDEEPVENETGDYVYDPTKWLVYEFDMFCPMTVNGTVYSPMRLKLEMNAGELARSTVFIKEVHFLKHTGNESEKIVNRRTHNYVTYVPNLTQVASVLGKASSKKDIYTLSGTRVKEATRKGVYINNGKKFVVQ